MCTKVCTKGSSINKTQANDGKEIKSKKLRKLYNYISKEGKIVNKMDIDTFMDLIVEADTGIL